MAKQINASVTVARGGVQLLTASGMTRNTLADAFVHTQITVGTSETTYTIPTDIGNAMEVGLRNLDTSNFVNFAVNTNTAGLLMRLRPQTNTNTGSVAFIPVAPTVATIILQADTAPCEVEVIVLEE